MMDEQRFDALMDQLINQIGAIDALPIEARYHPVSQYELGITLRNVAELLIIISEKDK